MRVGWSEGGVELDLHYRTPWLAQSICSHISLTRPGTFHPPPNIPHKTEGRGGGGGGGRDVEEGGGMVDYTDVGLLTKYTMCSLHLGHTCLMLSRVSSARFNAILLGSLIS